jgi:hypothetical protein
MGGEPALPKRLKTPKLIGNRKSLPNLQEPGMYHTSTMELERKGHVSPDEEHANKFGTNQKCGLL